MQKVRKKKDLRVDLRNWTTASGGALDLKADELTLATGPTNVIARERVIAGSVGVCGLLGGADAANPRRRSWLFLLATRWLFLCVCG